ncbi:MAG: hypothetical protein GYA39_05220 [Methanothrix sp.]|nr:hypothetical protein [Methanothrix sp.]
MRSYTALLGVLAALLMLPWASMAHVPLISEEKENISFAMHIPDPAKSWAIYGFIKPHVIHYYSLDVKRGQRIYLSLIKSANPQEMDFDPVMILIGPGIEISDNAPDWIQLPKDLGGLVATTKNASIATYEPFGPSSFIEMAELDLPAPGSGRYYVAVYSKSTHGHYGLVAGFREEFSFVDRIVSPIRLIFVWLWSGQSPGTIIIPYFVAEIVGILIFWRSSRRTAYSFAGTMAAFLFMATSATVIGQTAFNLTRAPFGPEVYISLTIALFHSILGVISLRLARNEAGMLQRSLMGIIGTMALLAGSGLIMGPILAIAASMLPSMKGSVPSTLGPRS